jgi:hypothetical protein
MTPVVALVKMMVPVALTPFDTPVIVTEKRTFCPDCTTGRVAANAPVALAREIVTDKPLESLGAKVASPA